MDKKSDQKDSPDKPTADIKNKNKVTREDVGRTVTIQITDETAGPSGAHRMLPGGVSPRLIPTGRSKSEHSMTQIITRQDVANALKLTSLSFAATNLPAKITNIKDIKIPTVEKEDDTNKLDPATLVDLKSFMAGCFKFSKEALPITLLPEVPVRVVSVIASEMQEMPNSSCDAQTESTPIPPKLNEVIVTKPLGNVETKIITRPAADKKKVTTPDKKSNLSERSDLGVSNIDSLSSIGSNVCRICMTRGRERLISPCNCKGSLANVHLSCLERWLNQVGRNHCELCGFSYPAIRTPRYTVVQALRLWFGNPRNRSHLQSDCLIFWLLSTVTAGLLAVCIVGTQYFVIEGSKFGKPVSVRKEEGISHRITETAMDFFMAVVLCGYSVTVYLLWKDHYVMWNRWRRANVNVRLLLSPDTSVPFVPRARYNVV